MNIKHLPLLPLATALIWLAIACGDGRPPQAPDINIFDAVLQENVSAVEQHMNAGTNPNQWIPAGWPWEGASPLHLAASSGNKKIVQLLLDNRANIEIKAKDAFGGTPLQWAAFWGGEDMVEFMVNAGANVNAKDNTGCTPLCATTVPNPFVMPTEEFKGRILSIQTFLKSKGAEIY